MTKQASKERPHLPACPNPDCPQPHVVRNGSHRGRQRYHCRNCKTYFGETEGTPMYNLKTPAAEVAQALLILMRRGSLRGAEEITGHKYETISVWLKRAATHAAAITQVLANDLHLSQVEIDEFWSFVQKKTAQHPSRTRGNAGDAWSRIGTVASWSPGLPVR
jgi:transposase-like protein